MAEEDISTLHKVDESQLHNADAPLSPAEAEVLEKLKQNTKNIQMNKADEAYWRSDVALRRFVIARQAKYDAAFVFYQSVISTRTTGNFCELISSYKIPQVMKMCFPMGILGLDKEGYPVLCERIGAIDLVGLQASLDFLGLDFLTWVAWYHELQERLMRRVSKKVNKNRHFMVCIVDMGGLSMRHLASSTLNLVSKRATFEKNNYPEVVKRIFLINTPSMFATVWGFCKGFLDKGTQDKMEILGSNFYPTLTKFMDGAIVPKFLGGSRLDEKSDPECKSILGPGGMVPTPYLVGIGNDELGLGEEVQINAGATSDLVFVVSGGSKIVWRWGIPASSGGDVSFSVQYQLAKEDLPSDHHASTIKYQKVQHVHHFHPHHHRDPRKAHEVKHKTTAKHRNLPKHGFIPHITYSICGIQQLYPEYSGPIQHGLSTLPKPATVASKPNLKATAIPGGNDQSPIQTAKESSRQTFHQGEFTLPVSDKDYVVMLRWDNSFSWMQSKLVARRIDVILPNDTLDDAQVEYNPEVVAASSRWDTLANFLQEFDA
jgi:CRAL/TRIO domain